MLEPKPPIPSFQEPPVVEVVWGVQFSKLVWLTAAHTGLYWGEIKGEYPRCVEQPPIPQIDEPEELLAPSPSRIEFSTKPPLCRQWFVSENEADLVQLQQDRFCINWRETAASGPYPRYESMRGKFVRLWRHFSEFAAKNGGTPIQPTVCEMTYVNHIYQQEGWDRVANVGDVFPALSWHGKRTFLPEPATLACELVFDLRGKGGRLHVSCGHGKEHEPPGRELIRLDLTARGRPPSTSDEGLLEWFALAREWIVRGFADLTSTALQERWRRER